MSGNKSWSSKKVLYRISALAHDNDDENNNGVSVFSNVITIHRAASAASATAAARIQNIHFTFLIVLFCLNSSYIFCALSSRFSKRRSFVHVTRSTPHLLCVCVTHRLLSPDQQRDITNTNAPPTENS